MPLGSLNPFPFRHGGGPTPASRIYRQLRLAVGRGGSADTEDGIDGLWRRSRAKGLAALESVQSRATLAFFPHLVTDMIPVYERRLGIVPAPDETLVERRKAVVDLWRARLRADTPSLAAKLEAIDPRISLLEPSTSTTSVAGSAFESSDNEPFGGDGYSLSPNFSTDFRVHVLFDVGYDGPPLPSDAALLERIKTVLLSVLPGWVDWQIMTSTGFLLDQSSLDLTGLTDP